MSGTRVYAGRNRRRPTHKHADGKSRNWVLKQSNEYHANRRAEERMAGLVRVPVKGWGCL